MRAARQRMRHADIEAERHSLPSAALPFPAGGQRGPSASLCPRKLSEEV